MAASTEQLIDDLARLQTEDAMALLVQAAAQNRLAVTDMWRLAEVLADSGQKITSSKGRPTADLASTGGPGSLSTLLCPLYLRSLGFSVPKLGVPGRPAGGIDVLAQLRGYKVDLDSAETARVMSQCGYVHFLAGTSFAPLDAALFRFRQKVGAQNIPTLAVASLLAKKIACGVAFAGLDVRVAAHGNFGADFNEAREAAGAFCAAAKAVGISAVACLTDARTLYQPFIGRGESLLALRMIFEKTADAWLAEHSDQCRLLAAHVAALCPISRQSEFDGDIAKAFQANIEAQGSAMDAFYDKTNLIAKAPRYELIARNEGFLSLDIEALRSIFTTINRRTASLDNFPDEFGLILHKRPGAYIRRGEPVASVRAEVTIPPDLNEPLTKCFRSNQLLDFAPGLEEVVRA